MTEGTHNCPAMPERLVDATELRCSKDLKIKTTREQWGADMDERGDYAMRLKEHAKDGKPERFACPASGTNPLVACPSKPKSMEERKTRQPDGKVTDARRTINPPAHLTVPGEMPQVCEQDTVTLRPEDDDDSIDKYRQELRYGTVQHLTVYVRCRQAQEGLHGFAKKHAAKALADPDARRVRGKAAQSLFAALLFAAASIAKIRSFLANAETDTNGDRWVEREPLILALRTPPGDSSPDEDDPPEELAAA